MISPVPTKSGLPSDGLWALSHACVLQRGEGGVRGGLTRHYALPDSVRQPREVCGNHGQVQKSARLIWRGPPVSSWVRRGEWWLIKQCNCSHTTHSHLSLFELIPAEHMCFIADKNHHGNNGHLLRIYYEVGQIMRFFPGKILQKDANQEVHLHFAM